jgi:DNA repair ATPase RecN
MELNKTETETAFANGMLHVFEPLVAEYDTQIRSIQLSQANLAAQIDALQQVLSQCSSSSASFVDVEPYLTKLGSTRKRIMNTASLLNTVNERLNRLNRLARNKYPEMVDLYEKERLKQQQQQKQSVENLQQMTAPKEEKKEEQQQQLDSSNLNTV